jgi:hypothetical protein
MRSTSNRVDMFRDFEAMVDNKIVRTNMIPREHIFARVELLR